ncbi:MAG: LysE family translocator [Bacteroidota bacterium]|nr:LysE family translocator [Bacteroidota bacterium]
MDFQILASFIIATTVLALSPGPDNLFVLIQSARYGKKSGMAVVVGLMSGCLIHTSVVAFGLSTLIESYENLYLILKIFGFSYMLFLAFKAHRSKGELNACKQKMPMSGLFKMFKQGFIMNVLNPKVSIFFLAFFPAFLFSKTIPLFTQFYILGFLFIIASFMVFSAYVILSNYFSKLFFKSNRGLLLLKRLQTGFFVGIAVVILTA